MRILFVTREYPPDSAVGGIGYNISGLAPGLVDLGHEVHVLSCFPGVRHVDEVVDGVHVHRRPTVSVPALHRFLPGPNLAPRLEQVWTVWRAYRRLGFDPDVVNIPDWFGEAYLLALTTTVPLVLYLHTPLVKILEHNGSPMGRPGRIADAIERGAARRATVITSTSHQLLDDLDGWLPPGVPSRVTPPPVRADTLADLRPADQTDLLLLAVGRIEARKAPEVLVDAAARLRADGIPVEVAFVGTSSGSRDGLDYVEWLRARADGAGVPVHLPGHLERPDLRGWFDRARAVVVASRYESFSLVALEAGAAGRPVVVTEGVGAKEVVAGQGGAVVPVGDAAALADAVRPWLLDADRAAADARALQVQVLAESHPSVASRRRLDAFELALAQPPPTRWRRLTGRG